ncbi:MAG TPA: site-specific integrase [Terriglobia bacterium]|nr:site-specific integrase [Terriglobia bacterium]
MANGRHLLNSGSTGNLTVNELLAAYLDFAKDYYRKDGQPTSEYSCIGQAIRFLANAYGHTPADRFGPLALKAVQNMMIQHGLRRRVINHHIERVKRVFKWAVANQIIGPDVYHALQTVSGLRLGRSEAKESDPVRPVADADVDAIMPYVSAQVWAIVELMRLTGMRAGEAVVMRGCDLDVTGRVWTYQPSRHKGEHYGHSRVVELGPRAQAIIKEFVKLDPQAYLFSPKDAERERSVRRRANRKRPLYNDSKRYAREKAQRRPRDFSDHYTVVNLRNAIQRACRAVNAALEEAGKDEFISVWHPHQLRHNFATRIRKEFGLETARVLLGHRSMAVSEIYAEADRAKVVEAIARVGVSKPCLAERSSATVIDGPAFSGQARHPDDIGEEGQAGRADRGTERRTSAVASRPSMARGKSAGIASRLG